MTEQLVTVLAIINLNRTVINFVQIYEKLAKILWAQHISYHYETSTFANMISRITLLTNYIYHSMSSEPKAWKKSSHDTKI